MKGNDLNMYETKVKIDGMMCGMCESHINDAIRNAFSVKKVSASHSKGEADIISEEPIDEAKLRAGFIPGVFATDVALRKVAAGTPWREAYHQVRDNLEALATEDPDAAVAAKTHAGATARRGAAPLGGRARDRAGLSEYPGRHFGRS